MAIRSVLSWLNVITFYFGPEFESGSCEHIFLHAIGGLDKSDDRTDVNSYLSSPKPPQARTAQVHIYVFWLTDNANTPAQTKGVQTTGRGGRAKTGAHKPI